VCAKEIIVRHGVQILVAFGLVGLLARSGVAQNRVALVVDAPLPPSARQALTDLERALRKRGLEPVRHEVLTQKGPKTFVIGLAGSSAAVDKLLAENRIALPKQAESLCLQKVPDDRILVAGSDARGLSYALLEAARAIELAPNGRDPLAAVPSAVETPFLRERSMTMHLFNADLEAAWYFSEQFWRDYFTMLAGNRYNNFTLTFSDQTNYLAPLYAYLVDVPGYAKVLAKGLTAQQRERNLKMLKRITELAQERGLEFTLGIWAQGPVAAYPGKALVENLPQGLDFANYCGQGLKLVLQACPAISGVQFRMNAESGVPEEKQAEFFTVMFRAIRDCGRPIRLDLRFKGLRPETIRAALELGFRLTVSFKFWCEHMGLPYHPTVADRHYRESRYSYGSALASPRDYRVVYQLWSVGSQRLLLWGDPEYAARFARSCRLGDGDGFEVFAPLTNKGYGNEPGTWRLFAEPSHEVGSWEFERYWYFYLVFGRLAYNPEAEPEIWRRELHHRFGATAGDVEAAYRHASQIIPFITATHLPSAGEWRWWPEMDTGGRLTEYMHVQPSDTAQFYAIRAWKRTPNWHLETWDETIPGYVDDAIKGRLQGKMTPAAISRKLLHFAEQTEQSLARVKARTTGPQSAEQRGTGLDLGVLAQVARFHAEKTRAATHLAFFEMTAEPGRLPAALHHAEAALEAWQRIVTLTDRTYYDKLVFGIPRGHPHSRGGMHHSGHWKDRLPEVEEDVAFLKRLLKQHRGAGKEYKVFSGETPLAEVPQFEHRPLTTVQPGRDLDVSVRVVSQVPVRQVLLHYRPLDQTADWKQIVMQPQADGRWHVTVPGMEILPRWDFMYYFEARVPGGGRLWPSWEQGPPYVVAKGAKR
jgi:hypothetical protein